MGLVSKGKIISDLIGIFLFCAPLSVCNIVLPNVSSFCLLSIFVGLLVLYGRTYGLKFFSRNNGYQRNVILFFFFPIVLSIAWSCFILGIVNDVDYYSYFSSDLISRILNITVLFGVFIISSSFLSRKHNEAQAYKYIRAYSYGVLIILGLFGVWQILSATLGIWCPDIQTRSHMYFARESGLSRITSLADEPSFLVPFLFDSILLFLFIRKIYIPILLGIIVLFSFSFAGYVEFTVLLCVTIILSRKNTKIKIVSGLLGLIVTVCLLFPDIPILAGELLASRKELQAGFKAEDTWRTMSYIYPIKSFLHSDPLTMLFGHGPASFKYLMRTVELDDMFTSSNNLFIDMLYEGGLISVGGFVLLMFYLWKKICASRTEDNCFQITVFKLFLIHIILTSCYRGDYASVRFISLFIVMQCLFISISNSKICYNTYSVLR